jgi:RimJ/RimL family protein N-acetyltransferase
MEIRVLTALDADEFQRLRLEGLRESPAAFSSSYEEECVNDVTTVAARIEPTDNRSVFGAFEDASLVGMVGFQRESGRKLAHKAFIWGMYVAPDRRGCGIGRRLIERVLSHAAQIPGLRRINLGVNAANARAIALYEAAGFERFGVEKAFLMVAGVEQDEIHMVRVLTAGVS